MDMKEKFKKIGKISYVVLTTILSILFIIICIIGGVQSANKQPSKQLKEDTVNEVVGFTKGSKRYSIKSDGLYISSVNELEQINDNVANFIINNNLVDFTSNSDSILADFVVGEGLIISAYVDYDNPIYVDVNYEVDEDDPFGGTYSSFRLYCPYDGSGHYIGIQNYLTVSQSSVDEIDINFVYGHTGNIYFNRYEDDGSYSGGNIGEEADPKQVPNYQIAIENNSDSPYYEEYPYIYIDYIFIPNSYFKSPLIGGYSLFDMLVENYDVDSGLFDTLTNSVVSFTSSLNSGIQEMVGVFYDDGLTTIGLLSVIVVSISLAYFLFRLIIGLIRMRG